MADELPRITNDSEYIIDIFSPVLNELRKNQGIPILLSSFPNLKNIAVNISNWEIILLKTNLHDRRPIQLLKFDEKHKVLKFYIILDELFFEDTKEKKELKNIIIVHEFVHFLAVFYSSISVDEETIRKKLIGRFSLTSGEINNNIPGLQDILEKENLIVDFNSYGQVNDAHFRTGIEKMPLDYAELFKNFLFPHQMLERYLPHENREMFFNLLKEQKRKEAQDLLTGIMEKIAEEESLPINFVINQTADLIMNFYLNEKDKE